MFEDSNNLAPKEIVYLSQKWSKSYCRKLRIELDEMIAIINLAIVEGLNIYVPSEKQTLIQFLSMHVQRKISEYIRREHPLHLSKEDHTLRLHLLSYQNESFKKLGRKCSVAELQAVAEKKTKKKVSLFKIQTLLASVDSLDVPVGDDDSSKLDMLTHSSPSPEDLLASKEQMHILNFLNVQERKLIQLVFGIECQALSISLVAQEMHLTKHQANQIYLQVMRKLREVALI